MSDAARRRDLRREYRRRRADAGVFRIVNTKRNRSLLGSTRNLDGMRNRFEFARSTESITALDHRLHADARTDGVDAFTFEVLDVLDVADDATDAQIDADLATLEQLWRDRLDPAETY
jgi:hypothetical protein